MAVHGRYVILFRADADGARIERILHSSPLTKSGFIDSV
jgi:hypothetical protein